MKHNNVVEKSLWKIKVFFGKGKAVKKEGGGRNYSSSQPWLRLGSGEVNQGWIEGAGGV